MELAGFDVIFQISSSVIKDQINQDPFEVDDTNSIFIFGGKFSFDKPVTGGTVRISGSANLVPIARSRDLRIEFYFENSSAVIDGRSVYPINGTATILCPLIFIQRPPPAPQSYRAPARSSEIIDIVLTASMGIAATQDEAVTVDLSPSSQEIDNELGFGKTLLLQQAFETELRTMLTRAGNREPGGATFSYRLGRNSDDLSLFSSMPELLWIDRSTLGIFGYYRKDASGGDVSRKLNSDLRQPQLLHLPGGNNNDLSNTVLAYPMTLLMSPDGFRTAMTCPAIRDVLALDELKSALYQEYFNAELSQRTEYSAFMRPRLQELYEEERRRNNNKNTITDAERLAAVARFYVEVDRAIAETTDKKLDHYFLETSEGRTLVEGRTPSPCGAGVFTHLVRMPDPFSDVKAHITTVDVQLLDGAIRITPRARADLSEASIVLTGTLHVNQDIDVKLAVTPQRTIAPTRQTHAPSSWIAGNATAPAELVNSFFSTFFLPYAGSVGSAIIEFIVKAVILSNIPDDPAGERINLDKMTNPLGNDVVLDDIEINPSGVALFGLVPRSINVNEFNPRVRLEASLEFYRPRGDTWETFDYKYPGNSTIGCPAASFEYSERFFDATYRLRLIAEHLPIPISVSAWSIRLGHQTNNGFGLDPRPFIVGDSAALVEGVITLRQSCRFEHPPLDGRIEQRDVHLSVVKDGGDWLISSEGSDGQFFIEVTALVSDGSGKEYIAVVTPFVRGEYIYFGRDYMDAKTACDEKRRLYVASLPPANRGQLVPKFDQVQNERRIFELNLIDSVSQRRLGAFRRVRVSGGQGRKYIRSLTSKDTREGHVIVSVKVFCIHRLSPG